MKNGYPLRVSFLYLRSSLQKSRSSLRNLHNSLSLKWHVTRREKSIPGSFVFAASRNYWSIIWRHRYSGQWRLGKSMTSLAPLRQSARALSMTSREQSWGEHFSVWVGGVRRCARAVWPNRVWFVCFIPLRELKYKFLCVWVNQERWSLFGLSYLWRWPE